MTIIDLIEVDPAVTVYHSVYPSPCYKPERAGTPIGNGAYHPRRYRLTDGIEVSLNKVTRSRRGLELKIGFGDHTENFLIPSQDADAFLEELNLTEIQRSMINRPAWFKPNYSGIKLTAFLNAFNKNKLFGLMNLVKVGDNRNLYQDRRDNIYFMSAPEGIGLGGIGSSFSSDPDIIDRLTEYNSRLVYSQMFSVSL